MVEAIDCLGERAADMTREEKSKVQLLLAEHRSVTEEVVQVAISPVVM